MPKKPGKYVPGGYKLKVKRSSAGLGLFAEEDIPKGKCVIEYTGRVISKEEEYTSRSQYLFEINNRKTIDGSARTNTARYINFSHRPNCESEIHDACVFIFSKRNIKAGEELSYDYGKEFFDEHIKPKGCKCPKCLEAKAA
ncbi:MAG: SET domain-containing protein [Candidatus Pacebacteria bacterium]|nr:SET domain-containing protein [Candidatus Paceibacterota bacterium]